MANQNLLKNSCLQQQSTTPDTLSFLPPWLPSSSCLLDVLIQGILRCNVWKSTCKVQNTYDGNHLTSYLTNQTSFSESWEWTFCFDYMYYLFDCECGKKVHLSSVHLKLPLHIIFVQIKSWSMLHHGSVGASLKQNKRNLKKPSPNP